MHCWSTWIFLSWVGAGQQNANEFSEISPVPMLPCHLSWEWGHFPPMSLWHNFPCRNFLCHRPKQFSSKKWRKIPFLLLSAIFVLLFLFRHFVLPLCTCHLFIYMNSVNINLHKIKQNNWKINHHSTPLRKCHNASDRVLTYGYFKPVCIDFRSLITTSTRTLASDLDALWYAYSHVHLMHIW